MDTKTAMVLRALLPVEAGAAPTGQERGEGMWRQELMRIATSGRGFHELTDEIQARVRTCGIRVGLCQLFLRHTSASLCVTENADPEVRADLGRLAARLAPDGDRLFRHVTEGPDDMPAHARSLLFGCELTVPIRDGRLGLGTWQGIFVWEHRAAGMARELIVTLWGEA